MVIYSIVYNIMFEEVITKCFLLYYDGESFQRVIYAGHIFIFFYDNYFWGWRSKKDGLFVIFKERKDELDH